MGGAFVNRRPRVQIPTSAQLFQVGAQTRRTNPARLRTPTRDNMPQGKRAADMIVGWAMRPAIALVLLLAACSPAPCHVSLVVDAGAPDHFADAGKMIDMAAAPDLARSPDLLLAPDLATLPDLAPGLPRNNLRVMPLGDSNTEGLVPPWLPVGGSYRVPLGQMFADHGLRLTYVGSQVNGPGWAASDNVITPGAMFGGHHHEGHHGYTIATLYAWITEFDSIVEYGPDVVTLGIGTNDYTQTTFTVAGSLATYATLLDRILADCAGRSVAFGDCKIVVTTIPAHEKAGTTDYDPSIRALNAGIAQLVAARPRCVLRDLYGAIGPWSTTTYVDAGHLNDASHAVWAGLLWDAMVGM